MTNNEIQEYEAMPHMLVDSPIKFFIIHPAISCTICYAGSCQVVVRRVNSRGLCEGEKVVHNGKEVLYLQKVNVYMEDSIVPYIYVKDASISDIMNDETEGEEYMMNSRYCNNVLLVFSILLLYGLFIRFRSRSQSTRKRRRFYGFQNKSPKNFSYVKREIAEPYMQTPLTSHKLVDILNTVKVVEEKVSQTNCWEVVSHRKRNFKSWYGPIKQGDFYSDS